MDVCVCVCVCVCALCNEYASSITLLPHNACTCIVHVLYLFKDTDCSLERMIALLSFYMRCRFL
jgi:hypothetical protein